MSRILLYVHFNKKNELSEYITFQLNALQPLFEKIVFISNSKLSVLDRSRIKEICNDVIERENIGYDFAAWRDGIRHIGWSSLSKYDSVTLMNDTCFGPVYPVEDMYLTMEKANVDFWGVTDHRFSSRGMPGTGGIVPHHIQSYMTVFNANVVKSRAFQNFWNNVNDYDDVEKVIQDYETQLTGVLSNAKFTWSIFFDTDAYSKKYKIKTHNYSELLPVIILKNHVPLLKIKSFIHTPASIVLREVRNTDYPTSLIKMHLQRIGLTTPGLLKYRLKQVRNLLRGGMKMIYNRANEL